MTSLYIHIPFCKRKCNYCDFVSYAGKEELIDEYVEGLIREFELLFSTFNFLLAPSEVEGLSTIYFGGGTPTLLEPGHFEKILETVPRPPSHVEITIESNPGTADKAKLKELRKLRINRISIGVQSFNDKHLQTLGRIHNSKEIFRFYDDARAADFENINLDLIFALPDQTLKEWKNDLQTAISLEPEHLSAYNLQVEAGTPFHSQKLDLPSEESELKMHEYAIETLTDKGYKHYEISSFAKPGFECKHNINYWKNGNYIGIGAGAHSHIDGKRWSNPNSIEEYLTSRNRESQVPSRSETIFLGLRLLEGISTDNFQDFEKELTELIESGLLIKENSHVKLTRKGLYLANLVFEKFV
ncbi:MAG: radical SAM family heme chaperone HemW [Candidatus Margulisiibacteriota bacterium]